MPIPAPKFPNGKLFNNKGIPLKCLCGMKINNGISVCPLPIGKICLEFNLQVNSYLRKEVVMTSTGKIFKEEEEKKLGSLHKGEALFSITGMLVTHDVGGNGRGPDIGVDFDVRAKDWHEAGVKAEEYLKKFNAEAFKIFSITEMEEGEEE